MKKHLWAFAQIIALFYSQIVFAGGTSGGGNVLICKDPQTGIETYQLLDYYEATTIYKKPFTIDLGPGTSELDKVFYVLQRLGKKDPMRAKMYEERAKDFFNQALFIAKKDLPALNDYGHVAIDSAKCRIAQLAVQRATPFPQSPLYTVRQEYWDNASVTDRAGLILHEVIYGHAMALGHKDSINSRYFNALVSSKELEAMSQSDYDLRIKAIGLQDVQDALPTWLSDPVVLPAVNMGEFFTYNLGHHAKSAAGDPLTFKLVGGSATWVKVDPNGQMHGIPDREEMEEFIVQARNSKGLVASAKVLLRVIDVSAIAWREDPIELNSLVGMQHAIDLNDFLIFTDHSLRISFSVNKLPPFVELSHDGVLRSTPKAANIGMWPIEVTATTSKGRAATTTVNIIVLPATGPKWKADSIFLPDAQENTPYSFDIKTFIENPTGETLKFYIQNSPSWLSLSADGILSGTPKRSDVGQVSFLMGMVNGDAGDKVQASMHVRGVNHPPFPRTDLIEKLQQPIPVGKTVEFDIVSLIVDIDGDGIGFSITGRPAWLAFAAPAVYRGAPTQGDIGTHVLHFTVTDTAGAEVKFDITLTVVEK